MSPTEPTSPLLRVELRHLTDPRIFDGAVSVKLMKLFNLQGLDVFTTRHLTIMSNKIDRLIKIGININTPINYLKQLFKQNLYTDIIKLYFSVYIYIYII